MKKFLILMTMLLGLNCAQSSFATQLPAEIKDYVVKSFPNATVRFDGLITMPDGTLYLPLLPAYSVKEDIFAVKYTYPEKKAFHQKPEVIVFTNNYCLLKLIKTKDGYTVTSLKDLPIEVRSGLLPQDLLVPKGLVLPDSLVGVLGDLNIPLTSNLQITSKQQIPQNFDKKEEKPKVPEKIKVIPQLREKVFFISNFNSNYIYIMPSDLTGVQYTLKLDSIPKAVKEVYGKYLLVSTSGKTYIDVVDIKNEEIAKQIDIGTESDEMILTKDEKTAYIISNKNSYVYAIDLATMALTKQIQIKGLPEKLSFSDDETKLIYQDSTTGDIYSIELDNNYVNIYQCNVPNVSKLALLNNKIYVLSRTRNSLRIFPYQEFVANSEEPDKRIMGAKRSYYIKSAFIATGSATKNYFKKQKEKMDALNYVENGELVETSIKPVDMLYHLGKFYILSAPTNSIDVFNPESMKIEKTISLNISGFSNKFNKIKNSNLVLITNAVEKQYVVFDLDKGVVLQKNPIDVAMTTLTVINKADIVKNDYSEKNQEEKTSGESL